MIQTLQIDKHTKNLALMFRWQGMNIYMGGTLNHAGEKYFSLKVVGAGAAVLTTDGTMATWSIKSEDLDRSDAGACTTSDGAAPNATETSTTGR